MTVFPGVKVSDKIGETEVKQIPLNSMPNIWIKQAYVQGFYYETITLNSVNMFEHMEIYEAIYEGVIKIS